MQNNYRFSIIQPSLLDYFWPKVHSHLERVYKHSRGEVDLNIVLKKLYNQDVFLVVITEEQDVIGAIVFEICTFDSGKKALFIPMLAADHIEDWFPQIIEFGKQAAKQFGCSELRGMGARKGWVKVLKEYGFDEAYVTVSLNVED